MPALRGVLLDLDGVVYVGGTPVAGAIDAVARLRNAGLGLRFITNTTRTPHSRLLERLHVMGLSVAAEELFTPALAARAWLIDRGLAARLVVHPDLLEDFAGLPSGEDVVVIGDAGQAFSYDALNHAFRALMGGSRFVSLAENRYFRDHDGALSLDAGPFVAGLAFACGRQAVCLGKPEPAFFNAALASMGCAPGESVMIGDDAEADIGGGMAAGLAGILVRTGKYHPGAEASIHPPPTMLADDLVEAAEAILDGRIGTVI